ncbi:ATP-dependent Clp protease ATP-binding subunit [Mycoplasmatota bacterium]|nr:ATP-dependent Clp protease ATP-binding subunit [Mycoplasmatota bacterium]
MYDKFSSQAKGIIIRSHRFALNQNEYVVGTEYLLLSLFNEPNSSCQILLKELKITENHILDEIKKINVFRKNIPGLVIYTPKFRSVLDYASNISKKTGSDFVYEEHLFYSLLKVTDCIAYKVLENLPIDIDNLITEITDVMGWNVEDSFDKKQLFDNFSFVENITSLVKKDKLLPLIGREKILTRITNILNKRNKRNVILIGNAGVGKSAIVEGLAQKYYKEQANKLIVSLNITSLLAGTKYRGDFEQRIKDFLDSVKNKEEVIVFIDEIHNIINVGNGDSNLDVANILKPSLARGELNCIGATTIDEYYKHIANDTALSRRFLPIFVDEPTLEETINILTNIKQYFEKFHQIDIPSNTIPYLCEHVEKAIINRYFPDKAIDVLDEACSYAKLNQLNQISFKTIDYIIKTVNNQHYNNKSLKKLECYPFLKKYFLRYYSNITNSFEPITSILCQYTDENQLNLFIDDISYIFNIRNEALKIINLNNFSDEHSISNLIGSPPGYVGFDNPNTLTKFVQKYPRSIILLKNIENCAQNITQLFKDILNSGYVEDLASNKIYFTNTIIIATENSNHKSIGFLNLEIEQKYKGELRFKEKINLNRFLKQTTKEQESLLDKYILYFKTNNKALVFEDFDDIVAHIDKNNNSELENLLYECFFNHEQNSFVIKYNEKEKRFFIKK